MTSLPATYHNAKGQILDHSKVAATDISIASMPDLHCFWHAIIQFVKFKDGFSNEQANRESFLTLVVLIQSLAAFQPTIQILRICEYFSINWLSLEKLRSILSHKAERKYDFANRPTILFRINPDNTTGHVGILVRNSGVKKIFIDDLIAYLESRHGQPDQPKNQLPSQNQLTKNIREKEKELANEKYLQAKIDRRTLDSDAFHSRLRRAIKNRQHLPHTLQDASYFSCIQFAADNLAKVKHFTFPASFTSLMALTYAAAPFKARYPELFEDLGQIHQQKPSHHFRNIHFGSNMTGFIPPVSAPYQHIYTFLDALVLLINRGIYSIIDSVLLAIRLVTSFWSDFNYEYLLQSPADFGRRFYLAFQYLRQQYLNGQKVDIQFFTVTEQLKYMSTDANRIDFDYIFVLLLVVIVGYHYSRLQLTLWRRNIRFTIFSFGFAWLAWFYMINLQRQARIYVESANCLKWSQLHFEEIPCFHPDQVVSQRQLVTNMIYVAWTAIVIYAVTSCIGLYKDFKLISQVFTLKVILILCLFARCMAQLIPFAQPSSVQQCPKPSFQPFIRPVHYGKHTINFNKAEEIRRSFTDKIFVLCYNYTLQAVFGAVLVIMVFYYYCIISDMWHKTRVIQFTGFVPKLVNSAAEERLKRSLLLAIYDKCIPKTKSKDESKGAGLSVYAGKIFSRLTGYISKDMNAVFMNYGAGFSGEQIAAASATSGGHPHARAIADQMQAQALTRIMERYRKAVVSMINPGHSGFDWSMRPRWYVLDIGAKFSKISRVIQQRLALEVRRFIGNPLKDVPIRLAEQITSDLNQIISQLNSVYAWNQANGIDSERAVTDSFEQIFGMLTGPTTVEIPLGPFPAPPAPSCGGVIVGPDAHNEYMQVVTTSADKIFDFALRKESICETILMSLFLSYQPIRPRSDPYDINYYSKQLPGYNDLRKKQQLAWCGVNRLAVFQGTVQLFEDTLPDLQPELQASLRSPSAQIDYLLFDSHYYLGGWTPKNRGQVFVCGGDFPTYPGTYFLPHLEGRFTIAPVWNGDAYIAEMNMYTSSSGTTYRHPLVHVAEVQSRMDYGWYAHIFHQCSSQTLRIQQIQLPPHDPTLMLELIQSSPQVTWFRSCFNQQDLSKSQTARSFLAQFAAIKDSFSYPFSQATQMKSVLTFLRYTHQFAQGYVTVSNNSTFLSRFISLFRNFYEHSQTLTTSLQSTSNFEFSFRKFILHEPYFVQSAVYQTREELGQIRFGCSAEQAATLNSRAPLQRKVLRDCAAADFPLPKKMKVDFKQSQAKPIVRQQFFAKPTPQIHSIATNYSCDDDDHKSKLRTMQQVNKFMRQYPEAVVWDKSQGKYIPLSSQTTVTPTAYQLITGEQQYEWSARAVVNSIHALYYRHLVPNIKPDFSHLNRFYTMVSAYFSSILPSMIEQMKAQSYDFMAQIEKKDWSVDKKRKYCAIASSQFQGATLEGSFKTMVKSGQVYYSDNLDIRDGYLYGRSDRPRNIMVPSQSLCGNITLMQSMLWGTIKKNMPEFIQGYTKEDLKTSFIQGTGKDWVSISMDGSGFDSTQHAACMDAVENRFMNELMPVFSKYWDDTETRYSNLVIGDKKQFMSSLLRATTSNINYCFTHIPLIGKAVEWPQDVKAVWTRDWRTLENGNDMDYVMENYIYNKINGTTFSGHPTKTTLGNTLRSICYAYYYIQCAGVRNPWVNPNIKVRAAGDDVVIICAPEYAQAIQASILALSSRTKVRVQDHEIGLGQCIEQVKLGPWYSVDFCSKWCFGSDANTFSMGRDVHKALTTKLYYTKQNQKILGDPVLHARAIYDCIKSQHISRKLQDILAIRYKFYGEKEITQEERSFFVKSKSYISVALAGGNYQAQDAVNEACSLTMYTVLQLLWSNRLDVVKEKREDSVNLRPSSIISIKLRPSANVFKKPQQIINTEVFYQQIPLKALFPGRKDAPIPTLKGVKRR